MPPPAPNRSPPNPFNFNYFKKHGTNNPNLKFGGNAGVAATGGALTKNRDIEFDEDSDWGEEGP